MAAIALLKGYGGAYTSETFGSSDTTAADTVDISHCYEFMVQIDHVSGVPTGTIQMENSLNNTDWASLGTTVNVATDGTISRFAITNGPFGLCRINPTGITDGSVTVKIVGF